MAKSSKVAVEKEAKSPAVKPKAKTGFVIKVPSVDTTEQVADQKDVETPPIELDTKIESSAIIDVGFPVEEVKEKPMIAPAHAIVAEAESESRSISVTSNVYDDVVKQNSVTEHQPVSVPAANTLKEAAKRGAGYNNEKVPVDVQEANRRLEQSRRDRERHDQLKVVEAPKHKGPFPSSKEFPPPGHTYPKHLVQFVLIIKNNAEIRRFTSLGVLNYLAQKQEIRIHRDSKKYVQFKWDKFTVKVDNLIKDYEYTNPFFINCLVASFASFASNSQNTINEFTLVECNNRLWDIVTEDEVNKISHGTLNR